MFSAFSHLTSEPTSAKCKQLGGLFECIFLSFGKETYEARHFQTDASKAMHRWSIDCLLLSLFVELITPKQQKSQEFHSHFQRCVRRLHWYLGRLSLRILATYMLLINDDDWMPAFIALFGRDLRDVEHVRCTTKGMMFLWERHRDYHWVVMPSWLGELWKTEWHAANNREWHNRLTASFRVLPLTLRKRLTSECFHVWIAKCLKVSFLSHWEMMVRWKAQF